MKKDKILALGTFLIILIFQISLIFPVDSQKIFAQNLNIEVPEIIQDKVLTQDEFLEEQVEYFGYEVTKGSEELLEDQNAYQLNEENFLEEGEDVQKTEESENEIIFPEELIEVSNEFELDNNIVDELEPSDDIVIEEDTGLIDEVDIEEIKPEITKIEFSLDSLVFEDSINAVGETKIFFRYALSEPNVQIKSEKAFLTNGNKIDNPFIIENYINQPITIELTLENNEKISATSQPINIFPDLDINEIYSYGTSSWIEIYNPTDSTVHLANYKLSIGQDEFVINTRNSTKEKSCSLVSEIKKGDYCVIYINYSLNNETISLKAENLVIDTLKIQDFSYYSSYIIKDNFWTETFEITLGKQNVYKEEPLESNKLMITEIYPAPDTSRGEYEWVEIYNYGNQEIDLTGWYFNDATQGECKSPPNKGVQEMFQSILIKSNEHTTSKESNTINKRLNNDSDTVFLCNPQNVVVDTVRYTVNMGSTANKGKTFGKPYDTKSGFYAFDSKILTNKTPNDFNIEPEVIEVPDPSLTIIPISEARKKLENEIVTVKGTATVDVNILGDTIIYIQDSTGGIRVDLPTGVTVNISKDQVIQVTGKIDFYHNETEIDITKVQDIKFADQNGILFPNSQVTAGNINPDFESTEGILVYTEGEIINNYSTSFDIQTGVGLLRVSILSSSGIDIPEKSKGDYAKVTGIFSQYDSTYRILPRYSSDIQIISKIPPISSATKNSNVKAETNTSKASSSSTNLKATSATPKKGALVKNNVNLVTNSSNNSASASEVLVNNDVNPGINLIKYNQSQFSQIEDSTGIFPIWIIMLLGFIISSVLLIFRLWRYYAIGDILLSLQKRSIQEIALQKGYFVWKDKET